MPLCFIEPQEAIRVVAESVGREARRQLLGEVVRAWVDEIPEDELESHYAKAVDDLDDDDLSMLAAWHASLEVGQPIANKEFLLKAPSAASASTAARRCGSPPASAATRPSRPASARSRRWTPSCPGCRRTGRWSSPPRRSSCTAGTAWAPTTEAAANRRISASSVGRGLAPCGLPASLISSVCSRLRRCRGPLIRPRAYTRQRCDRFTSGCSSGRFRSLHHHRVHDDRRRRAADHLAGDALLPARRSVHRRDHRARLSEEGQRRARQPARCRCCSPIPPGSGLSEPPAVLVQGTADVDDRDLRREPGPLRPRARGEAARCQGDEPAGAS